MTAPASSIALPTLPLRHEGELPSPLARWVQIGREFSMAEQADKAEAGGDRREDNINKLSLLQLLRS